MSVRLAHLDSVNVMRQDLEPLKACLRECCKLSWVNVSTLKEPVEFGGGSIEVQRH